MKRALLLYVSISIFLIFSSSCASIVSKSLYPFTVNTDPSNATVVIEDSDGNEVFNGSAPAIIELKAGKKFFKRESYMVHVSHDGYKSTSFPVNFRVDGWYWGNLLFGGLIGMLIVDPATGAMYKLDMDHRNITLSQGQDSDNASIYPSLKIMQISDLDMATRRTLIALK